MNSYWITASCVLILSLHLCQGLQCPYPGAKANSDVKSETLEVGSTATYTCDTGYELFGESTRTCRSDGTWSGEQPTCATNVAWRKPARQSSNARGGSAENANDGNPTSIHDGDKCSETQVEESPWWTVDLMQEYEISVVRIVTRACCGEHAVQDVEIRVGNSAQNQRNRMCAWNPGTLENGATKDFQCAGKSVGRYVFIQMVGVKGSLSLCEVEVFSAAELSKDRCKGNLDENKLSVFNGTCYEFQVSTGGNFETAKGYCQKYRHGNLLHQTTPMEQDFVVAELTRLQEEMKTKLLWIGVQKDEGFISRTWRYVDGAVVGKPPWGKDQPNNYNGEQNCVVLDGGREWLWNDIGCELGYLYWICQFQPSCGSPERQDNTTYALSRTDFDSIASYSCFEGSSIVGETNRSCTDDGYWSGVSPTCQYVDCQRPVEIDHATLLLVDGRTSFSAKAAYECSENYTMQGSGAVACTSNGQWTPNPPECLYSWCPDLTQPKHGKLSISSQKAGGIASFTCDSGYTLNGEKSLSCNLGGFWSGEEPTCEFIDCGLPENIKDGEMTLLNKTTYFGSSATYKCQDDFQLDGLPSRKCESNGYWTGQSPTCYRINCGEPEVPIGGYVTGYSFEVHSKVNYHCEEGHYLTGEGGRTCTRTSKWSGSAPTCTFVDCGSLPLLRKGQISFEPHNKTHLNSIATYACTDNFKLEGESKRTCQKNGQWTNTQPKCTEIRCASPGHPKKSRLKVTGNDRRMSLGFSSLNAQNLENETFKVGSQITYLCERSHVLDGPTTLTCSQNGTWSGKPASCKFVDCGPPNSIQNGQYRLLSNATTFGSVAAYGCHGNWKLYGKLRRHCLSNGTWAGPDPQCEEVLCPSLTAILEKRYAAIDAEVLEPWRNDLIKKREQDKQIRLLIDKEERRVGNTALYTCEKGRKLIGTAGRLCQQHGVWDGEEPTCDWVFCEDPEDLENGQVHLKSTSKRYGAVIEHYCLPQYRLFGDFNRTCNEEGVWSQSPPQCLDEGSDAFASGNSGKPRPSGDSTSYTGIYVGVAVAFLLLLAVGASLLFIKRKEKLAADSPSNSNPPANTDLRMNYGDLKDPTTGNHIYEDVRETDDNFYANITETELPTNPPDYYMNADYANENNYTNGNSNGTQPLDGRTYSNGRVPISQRPRMPPPQPPTDHKSDKASVTINGMTLNNNSS